MNFAKKLKEVVASNFIEIAKTEEETPPSGAKATPEIDRVAAPSYMDAPPVVPAPQTAARAESPTTARPVEGRAAGQGTPAVEKKPAVTLAPITPPAPTTERKVSASPAEFIPAPIPSATVPPPPTSPAPTVPAPAVSAPAASTPTSAPITPTPAPVVETSVAPAPVAAPVAAAKRSLIDIVAPNDPVDLEGIIKEASLPAVPFSAEQAAKVLSALPMELPLQVKRLTVKATMEAVQQQSRQIEPQEIVADAMLKKGHLTNYRDEFRSKVEALHRETDMEIAEVKAEIEREMARLKVEMDRLAAMKTTYDRKMRAVEHATDERIAQMEQVIVFFQSEVARELDQQVAERHKEEEEELPPFMRDEAVFRMLGLENENGEKEDDEDTAEEPMLNTSGKRARGQRRRFAVAENVEPTGHTA